MGWFPPKLINKPMKKTFNKKIMKILNETERSKTRENIWYFKLPSVVNFLNSLNSNYKNKLYIFVRKAVILKLFPAHLTWGP